MTLTESESGLSLGEEAPAFELPGVDGETHSLEEYRDTEALLVVFTCNHCPYAVAKFEELNRLAAREGVTVVGINSNDAEQYPEDSYEKMVEYVEDGRIDYDAYLRDESQSVAKAYGATCTPDPFLFRNEGGRFRLAYHGRIDDAMSPDAEPERFHMREAVEAVLEDRPVTFAEESLPSRGCNIKWRD